MKKVDKEKQNELLDCVDVVFEQLYPNYIEIEKDIQEHGVIKPIDFSKVLEKYSFEETIAQNLKEKVLQLDKYKNNEIYKSLLAFLESFLELMQIEKSNSLKLLEKANLTKKYGYFEFRKDNKKRNKMNNSVFEKLTELNNYFNSDGSPKISIEVENDNLKNTYIEPLPLDILKAILQIDDFTEYRISNSEKFKNLLEIDEKIVNELGLNRPNSFTEIIEWEINLELAQFKKDYEESENDFSAEELGYFSIVYLSEFKLFFDNALMINDLYQDFMQSKLTPSVLTRNWNNESFKNLLHPFLQMILKLDAYIEDSIYSAFDTLNCGKKIKEISELKKYSFEKYCDDINEIIESYNEENDDSNWNNISDNWKTIHNFQIKRKEN